MGNNSCNDIGRHPLSPPNRNRIGALKPILRLEITWDVFPGNEFDDTMNCIRQGRATELGVNPIVGISRLEQEYNCIEFG